MQSHLAQIPLKHRRPRLSFRRAMALWRSRRALSMLTETQLQDTGISRAQASLEAARPIWDAPDAWKC